jgi:hypothetical protein
MGNYQDMQFAKNTVHGVNLKLLHAAIRFNALMLGLTGGTIAAVVVYFATQTSVARWGADAGNYLGLLAVFFPGYSVSAAGAWIGALWAFVYAGTFSWLSYRLYGGVLGARIAEVLLGGSPSENPVLRPSIMRLHGSSLGLAIGSVAGVGLICSTTWLVVRGTAGESVHAALLANYIPGYSVSILGGILGGLGLFVFVFIACLLLAAVYNRIVEIRHG